MIGGITGYLMIGGVVAFGVVLGGFYWYYQSSQATIQQLQENNSKLETAIDSKTAENRALRKRFEQQKELTSQLQKDLNNSEENLDELRSVLNNHDLTNLSLKKPGLIENRINDGTKEAFDEFEKETAISDN